MKFESKTMKNLVVSHFVKATERFASMKFIRQEQKNYEKKKQEMITLEEEEVDIEFQIKANPNDEDLREKVCRHNFFRLFFKENV